MQNDNYSSYPNMDFPHNYTKNGQKKMMDKFLENEDHTVHTQSTNVNTSKSENISSKLDMSKILPLLLNKNVQSSDLLDILLPMLNKSNLPIKELLNVNKQNTLESNLPKKEPISISGYRRVE